MYIVMVMVVSKFLFLGCETNVEQTKKKSVKTDWDGGRISYVDKNLRSYITKLWLQICYRIGSCFGMLNGHHWLDAQLKTSSPMALVLFSPWCIIGYLLVASHAEVRLLIRQQIPFAKYLTHFCNEVFVN